MNKLTRTLGTVLLSGVALVTAGCMDAPVRNDKEEIAESVKRSNDYLTLEINQMTTFDHRMPYNEFCKVTGIERKFPSTYTYNSLHVRVDVTEVDSVEQVLITDEDGNAERVQVYLPSRDASNVHAKLLTHYDK
jgi:hypothetical protein